MNKQLRFVKTILNGRGGVAWGYTNDNALRSSLGEFYGRDFVKVVIEEIREHEARKVEATSSCFDVWLRGDGPKYQAYQFGRLS